MDLISTLNIGIKHRQSLSETKDPRLEKLSKQQVVPTEIWPHFLLVSILLTDKKIQKNLAHISPIAIQRAFQGSVGDPKSARIL